MSVFFFFQAEDGIRDYKVTGIQTCALPICKPVYPGFRLARNGAALPGDRARRCCVRLPQRPPESRGRRRFQLCGPGNPVGRQLRSEEHTSELQSPCNLVCRLLLEKKKNIRSSTIQSRWRTS